MNSWQQPDFCEDLLADHNLSPSQLRRPCFKTCYSPYASPYASLHGNLTPGTAHPGSDPYRSPCNSYTTSMDGAGSSNIIQSATGNRRTPLGRRSIQKGGIQRHQQNDSNLRHYLRSIQTCAKEVQMGHGVYG